MSKTGGERAIISRIRGLIPGGSGDLVKGIGDDCAILKAGPGRLNLVTLDTLVQGVHFDPAWHPAHELGRKSASVNISDIAAMGASPRFALLSLALPRAVSKEWVESFMAGFLEVLTEFGAVLIGGDTVASGHEIVLSITMFGEVAETEVLTRDTAKVDDLVLVGGFLGEAAAGLDLCRMGQGGAAQWQPLVKAHLDPTPQVELGRVLARSGLVHAMLDLSDGLATDLAHVCAESKVGAEVVAEEVPLSDLLRKAASFCGRSPLEWALAGGEDYQLLFTVAPDNEQRLRTLVAEQLGGVLYCVGRIVEGAGVTMISADGSRREISYQGFEHFAG
ncbi:MAG: thiamine-phosphate kinase [Desulfobulbaceae bacterium]|nr:thiamine-phosphate kinase [Desulfobulbaceae bacterium]HIJ78064.1 thiamine-phosphate kinase [Deltaproteobacteria bacterium]